MTEPLSNTDKMPVLFPGHGSPMNAIVENEFVAVFRKVAKEIPKPNAILCVSEHWETRRTFVTAMEKPTIIHDFGGYPHEHIDHNCISIDTRDVFIFICRNCNEWTANRVNKKEQKRTKKIHSCKSLQAYSEPNPASEYFLCLSRKIKN